MRLLLDTHAMVWYSLNKPALSKSARNAIENNANDLFISAVSIWEMHIKAGTGKLKLVKSVQEMVAEFKTKGATILDIKEPHAHGVRLLPSIHRDPFDRMLVSQAKYEGLSIVTVDENIRQYPVEWVW